MSVHPDAPAQIVLTAEPEDERLWVPQDRNVWFRPLLLNTVSGQWCNLLRVRRSGVLNRHRHVAPVHGYVVRGSWRYLEHDWVATAGTYVFEPPGETHTLVVDNDDEMITFFNIQGAMIYVDENGQQTGFDDVFTKIDLCRRHYRESGLPERDLEALIR